MTSNREVNDAPSDWIDRCSSRHCRLRSRTESCRCIAITSPTATASEVHFHELFLRSRSESPAAATSEIFIDSEGGGRTAVEYRK